MSHSIIIRGGAYSEDNPPAEGHTSVEVYYTPSHGLTEQQVGEKVAKLLKLTGKIYALEGAEEPHD